jgi:type IV pilus assembly protein PilC
MAQQTFAYTALDAAGARRTGMLDADSRDAAVAQLAAEGRFVLDIKGADKAAGAGQIVIGGKKRPSRQDIALFTRRMSDLASAGLPLDRVLQVVAEQSESATLREVADEALEDVRGGLPVSQALAKHPRYFNEVYTQTLRAGEASGQFGDVAGRLADFMEKEVMRRSQVVSALIYPAILSMTALSVIVFLMTFVVPKLAGVFSDMGSDLPVTTQMLMSATDFMSKNWIVILITTAVAIVGTRVWVATPAGAETRDRFLLTAPIVGPVIRKATVSRFARVLGTLVYGGVPILDAIEIAGLSAGNRVFLKSSAAVGDEVRAGRSIAEAMRDAGRTGTNASSGAFPPVLTHMVAIGEETGDLPKMLGRVAESLDFEVDTGMRRLVSLVEPLIVLTMGSFVGFVVLSVLLPIFNAQSVVK